ncbi:AAA family ATPase [Baekduia soli]|uniref:AAA family ATPase n=1 Tax=Baekduia soli TaxID=496014 RepID=A0A5B8U5W4_9ACTN|nr:ATP-binding protein [Baekduia soli]QEC48473.1 AAA family ATPase [Baekduia soli]
MASTAEPTHDWFSFLDARVATAVRAAALRDTSPDEALRGLYISDEQALALADEAGAIGAQPRLERAAQRLGLDALDAAVLAVCAAPELHPRFGRLFAYLQDDVTRRLPSPRLAADLLAGDGIEPGEVLGCFGPRARLSTCGAVRLVGSEPSVPLAERAAKLGDRLAGFLLGAPALAESGAPLPLRRLAPQPMPEGRDDALARIASLLGSGSALPVLVCGPDAGPLVAAAAGRPLVLVDARTLEDPVVLPDAVLAAALEGAVLCLDGLRDLAPPERARVIAALDAHRGAIVLLAASGAEALAVNARAVLSVEVPLPGFAERRQAWERRTGGADAHDVAAKFRLSLQQIDDAAEVSLVAARAAGRGQPSPADLDLGARHASSSQLGELATRLPAGPVWEELVLPDRQRDRLRSISAYLRHRDRVLSDWGYERTVARTQGIKVLFAGESGTGKTMASQVLASELGLDIFRVDLATVVSKYIGETEKNLERIFGAADGSNAILFFDEADALFGKRSEVSDAHDRYANIEVAYLLQRMEAYPGAVILATNFKRNIDDAFLRRLDVVVDFPFPEAEDRRRIWELLLPAEAPVDADLDLDFLATQFKLSGGAIRNCSLAAAFLAADEDTAIGMRHLVLAVAQEYAKQGRLTLEADFGGFHDLVRMRGTVA